MEIEIRKAPRARVKLAARWEGAMSRDDATVTDLSRTGCFVLTGGKTDGDTVVERSKWVEQNCKPVLTVQGEGGMGDEGGEGETLHECTAGS